MAASSPHSFALTDSILFTGEAFIEGHALLIESGHVLDIVSSAKLPANLPAFSCAGHILAPGFIDCQVNGGGGILLNKEPTPSSTLILSAAHAKSGTTRLLPTLMTALPEVLQKGMAAIREAKKKNPGILGPHLEGPHIAAVNKGVHEESHIRPLEEKDIERYIPQENEVLLVTLAPEAATPEQVRQLVAQGVIVSLGHTAASPEALRACLAAGAKGFTHLYNAMGPMSARAPGPAGVALDDRESWCSLIADGRHVCSEMIRLAMRAKPEDKLFFVSDAVEPAGCGKPFVAEGPLRGAVITLGEMVSYAIREMKLDPDRVLRMASAIPAAFLGLDKKLGKLLPGYEADIVALDHFFKAQMVWRSGDGLR